MDIKAITQAIVPCEVLTFIKACAAWHTPKRCKKGIIKKIISKSMPLSQHNHIGLNPLVFRSKTKSNYLQTSVET